MVRPRMAPAALRDLPYRPPPRGGRARVAFVGEAARLAAMAPAEDQPALRSRVFGSGAGGDPDALRAALDAFAPHAVIAVAPETLPPGLLAELPAATVGCLDEAHAVDPDDFDRLVTFDPDIALRADEAGLPVWRTLPPPVADRLYGPARRIRERARILFDGEATKERQGLLRGLRERFEVTFAGGDLARLLPDHHVAIVAGDGRRVGLYLAAGLLVVSEPLGARHGLEPGLDHLEAESPWDLLAYVQQLAYYPASYDAVCARGRRKAEAFRASRVYARLLADLWADLAAFGARRSDPHSATSASASRTSAG